jgi:hypothetical protein
MLVGLEPPRRRIDRRRDARQREAEHAPGEQELSPLAFRREVGDASPFFVGHESPAGVTHRRRIDLVAKADIEMDLLLAHRRVRRGWAGASGLRDRPCIAVCWQRPLVVRC